ncbi:MAG: hypothetical protein M1833_001856 [Piccolia ochrophora]|nr:MAG: hypothetical protein M1833_001856 [Piccolia ochrophora]
MASSPKVHSQSLKHKLADALPKDVRFTCYHLSTPPTKCPAIFSAPPNKPPEPTTCENQFLAVVIDPTSSSQRERQLIFAVEILIYTTSTLTTIFVSKADSTGYLHLLRVPPGSTSPLKTVSTTFISHLVKTKQRLGIKLVVSLFARAQDQYLFPGSVDNSGKHVLDDRGLIRWWCRTLDPVLRSRPGANEQSQPDSTLDVEPTDTSSKAYTIVPGLDTHETASLFPPTHKTDPAAQKRWHTGHPLLELTQHPTAPTRSLIPHFPDDPKARYLDELDDEVTDATGSWKSVRSLDQFWDAMQFRQECSSGRLVGFIWIVFTPSSHPEAGEHPTLTTFSPTTSLPTPASSQDPARLSSPGSQPHTTSIKSRRSRRLLTGPIIPRTPRIKPSLSAIPTSSNITDPATQTDDILLPLKLYTRIQSLLLRLDFSSASLAAASTARWTRELAVVARRGEGWEGMDVVGRKDVVCSGTVGDVGKGVNVLGGGLIRKRKSGEKETSKEGDGEGGLVNVLASGLVRKKPKT